MQVTKINLHENMDIKHGTLIIEHLTHNTGFRINIKILNLSFSLGFKLALNV